MRPENTQPSTVIVLVEPSGPLNLGSVARLCKNFGVHELRLVAPHCEPNDPLARLMAVKGIGFLEKVSKYSSLIEAVADCQRVVATCGRKEHGEIPLSSPEVALRWISQTSSVSALTALVFGREDRGLTNKELQVAQKVISLKTNPNYPSLNLSHAVAVVLHALESYKLEQINRDLSHQSQFADPAPPIQLDEFLKDAEKLLLDIGFLLDHTAAARMSKVKALLQRAEVRADEVSLIRGMVRQLRWAIHAYKP